MNKHTHPFRDPNPPSSVWAGETQEDRFNDATAERARDRAKDVLTALAGVREDMRKIGGPWIDEDHFASLAHLCSGFSDVIACDGYADALPDLIARRNAAWRASRGVTPVFAEANAEDGA